MSPDLMSPDPARRSIQLFLPVALLLALGAALGLPSGPAAAETLVVANKSEATVSLLDLPGGEVMATLPTGVGPHEVAVSPDGRLAVVTDYGQREAGSTLTVIDLPGAEVVRTIDLGDYRRPHGVLFLDGRRVLVTAEARKALIEVDVETGEVLRAVGTDQEVSHMVAVTPEGGEGSRRAFVANIGSGSVTAIDLEAGEKLADIATGKGAEGVAVEPAGEGRRARVWVTNREADTVTVLDAESLDTLATLEAGGSFPIRAQVLPDGSAVLVSNARSGTVSVIDTASLELRATIPMQVDGEAVEGKDTEGRLMAFGEGAPVPIGIVVHPDGRRAFVANANADVITVLDLEAGRAVGLLEAGREPDGMAYSPVDVDPAAGDEGSGDASAADDETSDEGSGGDASEEDGSEEDSSVEDGSGT